MSGDYSRFTFDETERFSEVLHQQGRVRLDSDLNEQSAILTRRDRTAARDVMSDLAVPRATTPNAFRITAAGAADLAIGAGRMYVDGVLAEAFASDPLTYATQPFYPNPPALGSFPAGRALAYLDVWEREITAVQDPDLLEPALRGIDTTTRGKTIWQVKILQRGGLNCGIDLNKIFPPSPARLTVSVDPPGQEPDPCVLPEAGGFRDVENHHYRVEVHGSFSPPKFKFSRDPIQGRIEEIKPGVAATESILKVERTGRDSQFRFSPGDRIEVLSERLALREEPGTMAVILKVDETLREITIDRAVAPAGPSPDPHAWITKWDQENLLDPDHLLVASGGPIALESGISVEITGAARHGEFWMFAAREATHSAGPLVNARSRGVIHHYAPLALIDNLGTKAAVSVASDCRTLWPPDCDCECASCVNPEDHRSGKWTIQMAIDKVTAEKGGKVCLKPGTYTFEVALHITGATSLWLNGHGECQLLYTGGGPAALLIDGSNDIVVDNLSLTRSGGLQSEATVIAIRNTFYGVVVRHCTLKTSQKVAAAQVQVKGIGIGLDRAVRDTKVLDCEITAPVGIGPITDPQKQVPGLLVALGIEIRGNTIDCTDGGILLVGRAVAAVIRENTITAVTSGIRMEGTTRSGFSNIVDGNQVTTARAGIGTSADRTTIANNVILGRFVFDDGKNELVQVDQTYSSIALYTNPPSGVLSDCLVSGNHCSNTRGHGVLVADPVEGLIVTHNFIRQAAGAGVFLLDRARRSNLKIEGNEIRDVALGHDDSDHCFGIRLAAMCEAEVAANVIERVGLPMRAERLHFPANGIRVDSPIRVRIHENRIRDVAATPEFSVEGRFNLFSSAAIYVTPPLGVVEITNNIIHTRGKAVEGQGQSPVGIRLTNGHVYAIRVQAPPARNFPVFTLPGVATQAITDAVNRVTATGNANFTRVAILDGFAVVFPGFWWVSVGPATSLVLIRANTVECEGDVAVLGMVRVVGETIRCTFGGNICAQRFEERQILDVGVFLGTETVVADSNQIFGRFEGDTALGIRTSGNLWTVLGNIVQTTDLQRGIFVNGVPLSGNWRELNRFTF
ncbi:MAG: hypothetical protein QOI24_1379 [Acidobacteriota bacterium]|jgi:nitrous oxidase accessory protein NosD|nr:hypothetical protein [Acidobacteriota bacterium]